MTNRQRGSMISRLAAMLALAFIMAALAAPLPAAARPIRQSQGPAAQANQAACSPLDVVLLIDQSGSMSGANGGPVNDPNEQREYAPKAVVDLLIDNSLDHCKGVLHRVAVISYGTEARVDLPLSEIRPQDVNEASDLRAGLKAPIQADNLGQTHPQAAFELATAVLNQAGAPPGEGNRKRVIIFITDGEPCLTALGCGTPGQWYPAAYAAEMRDAVEDALPFDAALLDREACLKGLRDQLGPEEESDPGNINACLENNSVDASAYAQSTYIWMILLRSGIPYAADLQAIYRDMAESHAGSLIPLSDNRNEVPATFRAILEQLTGVRAARLYCGNFAVDPYLKRATLVFYKFDESVTVNLSYLDAAGVVHSLSNGQPSEGFEIQSYYREGANERYELLRPYPGIWRLESENCDGLDAFYEPIAFSLSSYERTGIPSALPQRDQPPYYDQEAPSYLVYQMTDEAGEVVPQADHSQFEIDITARVTDPQGREVAYEMEWSRAEQLYRAVEPLQVPTAGRYSIHIIGATLVYGQPEPTQLASTQYSEVFDTPRTLFDQSAEFNVFAVTSFHLEIMAPANGTRLEPIHGPMPLSGRPAILPIAVQARVVDRQGQPLVNLSNVLTAPADGLSATLTAGGDNATMPLALGSDGTYIGEFSNFDARGAVELEVRLVSDFHPEYYPDSRRDQVTFERQDREWLFEILTPADQAELRPIHQSIRGGWPLLVEPIDLRVRLVDSDGQPTTSPAILAEAPAVLTATVTAGEAVAVASLLPDPAAPGEYVGQIAGLDVAGPHALSVDLELDYPGYFSPRSVAATSTFTRSDLLFTAPAFYRVLLILLILYLIFRAIRYFAIRTNPVRGTLAFLDSKDELVQFGLYSGRNFTRIKPRVLKQYPQLELKRLSVASKGRPRRGRPTEDGDGAWGGDDGVSITVNYTTDGGQRLSADLPPNLPTSFGEGTFQMEYQPPDYQSSGSL